MIRILSRCAYLLVLYFLIIVPFSHRLQAFSRFKELPQTVSVVPDKPHFGSLLLQDNQIIQVGQRPSSDEIPPDKIKEIEEEIVFNPSNILKINQGPLWAFRNEVFGKNNQGRSDSVSALIENSTYMANQHNFLWMFDECLLGPNHNFCDLNRLHDTSQARNLFEEKVVSELENQLRIDRGVATLVDVGSGDLFQDLVLVTKTFKRGEKSIHLNIVLIDPYYKEYIKAMNNIKGDKKLEKLSKLQEYYIQITHGCVTQLSQWVEQAYPQHKLNIFLYESVDAYAVDLAQKPHLQANIYMGVDLDKKYDTVEYLEKAEDDRSENKNGSEAYWSAPLDKILKSYGVGLMLTKDCLDGKKYFFSRISHFDGEKYIYYQMPIFRNHCIKILPLNASRPNNSEFINPKKPMLYGRYVVLAATYKRSILVRLRQLMFGRIK